ncbi:hypothetical protein J6TS1_43960 [Siminovitchia terrae]|uniref:GGDEF domain-containing protein n=1 Tax=Siminovitchia terrae TaxID=1914933 RepID=A0A429XAN3_SIMTE|nr:diguanylate cyclase [Siminovitchia terrae]RST60421.1 GGDEF domain-containing protein [Siminovitchia terrae]GIN91866.1 hypothetical protein J22TS1_29170 [Siminovitchia terrae]GIN98526.1 hypothetical protein J6TS1_43960 [Siminovitchia terrae]
MFQSILSNLAIILLGHLLMSTLISYKERFSKHLLYFCIVALFSTVIITMLYLPISFGDYRLSLSSIPLIFLALFRGWKIALPVLFIASIWRLFMGGDGALPFVIFGIVLPTIFTLLFYERKIPVSINLKLFFIITVCWLISDLPIILFIPNGMEIFKNSFLLRYVSFLSVAFIYCIFILVAYKNERLKQSLEFLASHDPLTNLLNRNKFIEIVEVKVKENHTNHYIALLDIDHFKQLNDTHGHLTGDSVLREISSIFNKYESDNLKVARYGGEEFIFYLKTIYDKQAVRILEHIQNEIRTTPFHANNGIALHVTVSIGLAKFENGSRLYDVIHQADNHLYSAKNENRDQLVVSFE